VGLSNRMNSSGMKPRILFGKDLDAKSKINRRFL